MRSVSKLVLSSSVRLYSLLLLAYPSSFRREYGEPMVMVFRDLCRDALRRRGGFGLVGVWLIVLPDWFSTTVEQYLLVIRKTRVGPIAQLKYQLWNLRFPYVMDEEGSWSRKPKGSHQKRS